MYENNGKKTRFPNTRWSLVGRAGASDDPVRQKALAELLAAYLPGLKAFLIASRRLPPDLADDLVQSFVADKVLAAGLVKHAERGRGKFRSFVMKSLSNFASTRLQQERGRHKRVDMEMAEMIAAPDELTTDQFDLEWTQQVVRDALATMEVDCKSRGRADLWEVFRLRLVDPLLKDAKPAEYGDIIRALNVKTPRQAINLLANAKRNFEDHVRAAVGKYVTDEKQIERELEDLRRSLYR